MGKEIQGILGTNLVLYICALSITYYTRFPSPYNEVFYSITSLLIVLTVVGMILRQLGRADTKLRKCIFLLVHLGQCLVVLAMCVTASVYTAGHCPWDIFYGFSTKCEYRITICVIYFLAFSGEAACIKAVKSECDNNSVEPEDELPEDEPEVEPTYPTQTVVQVVPETQVVPAVQVVPVVQTYPTHTVLQPANVTVVEQAPTTVQQVPTTVIHQVPTTVVQPVPNVQALTVDSSSMA